MSRFAGITAFAEACIPPDQFPKSVGNLIVEDIRSNDDPTRFSNVRFEDLVKRASDNVAVRTGQDRDVVIYVHGFQTSLAEAECIGSVLRNELANVASYSGSVGPDVFVFGWPGEHGPFQFSEAQDSASRAGEYLAGILRRLPERRIILVAHSLGAAVVMRAAAGLPTEDGFPPLAGILLVEGAIPATSLRSWRSTYKLTHPAAEMGDLAMGVTPPPPYIEVASGRGVFVGAAVNAEHLVFTTAGDDIPLSNWFVIDEIFRPSTSSGPIIPPAEGGGFTDRIDRIAIGTPFPDDRIYRSYEEVMPDPLENTIRNEFDARSELPSLRPTDPTRVLSRSEWTFEFHVPHPSHHEIRLDEGQWWRFFFDWHGVLKNPVVRNLILDESWRVFNRSTE